MNEITLPPVEADVPSGGMTIGEVAQATGLSIQALRYYEREGLMLDPAPRDGSGRRRYGVGDLAWIGGLLMLRDTGMSVSDMRALADLSRTEGTESERLRVLEAHRERVLEELARTRQHLLALDTKINAYRDVIASQRGALAQEGSTIE
ncbi:MerR family transcriptional regulator [Microbacterium shaanxiense]